MTALHVLLAVVSISLFFALSYIIVRRKMFPWSGGMYFITADGKQIKRTAHGRSATEFFAPATIIGFFLPGASAECLPHIIVGYTFNYEEVELSSFYYEQEDGGVKATLACPVLIGEGTKSFYVVVRSPYAFRGENADFDGHAALYSAGWWDKKTIITL